jgi:uncharacterized membrane protein
VSEELGVVALVAATITMGLAAGAFVLYAHTVMPALRELDDQAFVRSFRALDVAIINPWFMGGGFLGAPVLTAVAAAAWWDEDPFWWIVGALAAYAVTFVVTMAVNVPRNDALKAAGDTADPAAVRSAFDEHRWALWNLLRVLTCLVALALLCVALVVAGGT